MQKNVEKFGISDKRGRTPTSLDPYQMDKRLQEPSICQNCHAIYRHKQWHLNQQEAESLQHNPDAMWVTCPACAKIAEHYPEGVVTLRGDYLWKHEHEIRNLLQNEAEKVMSKNPLSRIIQIDVRDGEFVIETTDQKLAEHLGKTLNRAHDGELQCSWSRSPRVCRVNWERWL